jgi:outer membrane protein assembly factor BamA
VPLEPEVAKNGNILNIWTLDLKSGELRQYTDAVGGNFSPIVLNEGKTNKIAFVSYFKNEYTIRTLDRKEPLHTAASSDFGAPGPIIDFQAPLQHTLVKDNQRKKGTFEKMFLEGRPPVNVGVTNNGDIFGGTQVSFGDVLGDKQVNLFAASISQYRTLSLSYVDLSRRFQWALQGYSQTQFFYGQLGGLLYDPSFAPLLSRSDAIATRTVRGGSIFGIYPFSRYRRVELSAGVVNLDEEYNDPNLQAYSQAYQQSLYGTTVLRNGTLAPLGAAFIQETTVFREFGPLAGSTMRLAYDVSPKVGGLLSRQTFDGDVRHYLRLGGTGLLATRVRGFKSTGDFPDFQYFGGNGDLRGYDYLEFAGQNMMYANAELRFPLIEAALTPIGVIGGIRGVFFAGIGAAWFSGQPSQNPCVGGTDFKFSANTTTTCQVPVGYQIGSDGQIVAPVDPVTGVQTPVLNYRQQSVSGFRLQDGRASYGIGLETFALGFPIHFDWSWRTLMNRGWEDVVFGCTSLDGRGQCVSSSAEWRKPRFAVWIGYDF